MGSKYWSIFTQDTEHCFLSGTDHPQWHHVFFGNPFYRKRAEEDGFMVPLDIGFHTGTRFGVHHNIELDLLFKKFCQEHYEETHTREEFIQRYGKSYL